MHSRVDIGHCRKRFSPNVRFADENKAFPTLQEQSKNRDKTTESNRRSGLPTRLSPDLQRPALFIVVAVTQIDFFIILRILQQW